MGRPSKLTDAQWDELAARLTKGEKAADLARVYGVSKTAISVRVSKRAETVKSVAHQVVAAHEAVAALSVSDQVLVLTLADELRAISTNLASAARLGAQNAHRLNAIANEQIQRVDDANPLASMAEIKAVAVLTEVANKSAHIGLNLLAANKGNMPADPPPPPKALPADVMDAAVVYAQVMG
jgi:hypothetical protein